MLTAGASARAFRPTSGKSTLSRLTSTRGSGAGQEIARQRILAVDDDVTLQEVLTFFLGTAYEVRPATTGADALTRVCHEPIDLVVLDHPFKLGVADYLQKPVNAVDLVGVVHRILPSGLERSESSQMSPMLRGLRAPLCTPIQRAMGMIQQRYWDKFSLEMLARQVGLSKYRLSHRFREVLGITFRDYLLNVRLERAKALLAADDVSISEVAQMVGFGDLPRLDKVFKRYTGFSPSAYRSMARNRSDNQQ